MSIEVRPDCIVIYPENVTRLRGLGVAVAEGSDASDYVKRLRSEWETAK